ILDRRAAAGAERAAGRDVARRPAPVAFTRLRPARRLAPQALPRPSRDDGPVAGVRQDRPQLRRPRAARLLLPGELVDLARHHDPRQDAARCALFTRRVLTRAALAVALLLVLAGCGGGEKMPATTDAQSVESAFRGQGIVLRRLPTSGAEQPAMGVTS